ADARQLRPSLDHPAMGFGVAVSHAFAKLPELALHACPLGLRCRETRAPGCIFFDRAWAGGDAGHGWPHAVSGWEGMSPARIASRRHVPGVRATRPDFR